MVPSLQISRLKFCLYVSQTHTDLYKETSTPAIQYWRASVVLLQYLVLITSLFIQHSFIFIHFIHSFISTFCPYLFHSSTFLPSYLCHFIILFVSASFHLVLLHISLALFLFLTSSLNRKALEASQCPTQWILGHETDHITPTFAWSFTSMSAVSTSLSTFVSVFNKQYRFYKPPLVLSCMVYRCAPGVCNLK